MLGSLGRSSLVWSYLRIAASTGIFAGETGCQSCRIAVRRS